MLFENLLPLNLGNTPLLLAEFISCPKLVCLVRLLSDCPEGPPVEPNRVWLASASRRPTLTKKVSNFDQNSYHVGWRCWLIILLRPDSVHHPDHKEDDQCNN